MVLAMFRVRRYRVFVAVAVFSVFVLYHFTRVSSWDDGLASSVERLQAFRPILGQSSTRPASGPPSNAEDDDASAAAESSLSSPAKTSLERGRIQQSSPTPTVASAATEAAHAAAAHPAVAVITTETLNDGKKLVKLPPKLVAGDQDPIGLIPHEPGRLEPALTDSSTSAIHWTSLTEHFPVPTDSIIPLPSGKPKAIPHIQHQFARETESDRTAREAKLARIKQAAEHAWEGYRTYAWRKDELRPVTRKFRNPFGGWAATLVDSLDTLWIMGLHDEFEDAVRAVNDTDFTTSIRDDIPLFETTIRYLGGLLGAFDVSAGRYPELLAKAVELGDVLMGAFDTPNRMPMAYYRWKPAFASQPHRASPRVVLAELGSLSLEFTRLAQLTHEDKYYDAVARITQALRLWQSQTKIPGLWPTLTDASGCRKPAYSSQQNKLSMKADRPMPPLRADPDMEPSDDERVPRISHHEKTFDKRQLVDATLSTADEAGAQSEVGKAIGSTAKGRIPGEADCEAQGLASPPGASKEKYSLGSLADSTYEYLPKEYLLLGGLEDEYRSMYEDAMSMAKRHLLFRPMIKQDMNILIGGIVEASTVDEKVVTQLVPESEHLTCFIGGMFGMGGKIFGRSDDVELASRLTDGCVWAYENAQTGIMPEVYTTYPCVDAKHCPWNETAWMNVLDPYWDSRRLSHEALYKSKEPTEAADEEEDDDEEQEERGRERVKRTPPPRKATDPAFRPAAGSALSDPPHLLSHEEFVQKRVEEERLSPGFVSIRDRRYVLRPEAIESVFYMYRITGDDYWREKGWKMFQAVRRFTRTEVGHSAIEDVTSAAPAHTDQMESFWLAETLKYYYLLFSDPDVINLDEYVLNTEAHPFKRPRG